MIFPAVVVAINNDAGVHAFGYDINLGQLYINDLVSNHSASLHIIQNLTLDEGIDLVQRGGASSQSLSVCNTTFTHYDLPESWGVIVIPTNLTSNLVMFAENPNTIDFANSSVANSTQLQLYMDLSNFQVTITVRVALCFFKSDKLILSYMG